MNYCMPIYYSFIVIFIVPTSTYYGRKYPSFKVTRYKFEKTNKLQKDKRKRLFFE